MTRRDSDIEKCLRGEPVSMLSHLALYASSLLYGLGVRTRLALYNASILKPKKLPCKVISIGNITVGGTGKTPITLRVAEMLKELGLKPVILSRGYKGGNKGVGVVSDGTEVLMDAESAGDEPYLMARRITGVPIIVSADRVAGGLHAIERFSPDCIVLDDGFQHVRLARDLNILLVDEVAGFGNGYLLPRGPLREPIGGLKRAGLVMIKGGVVAGPGGVSGPGDAVVRGLGVPVFDFGYRSTTLEEIAGDDHMEIEMLDRKRILAFAGTARPDSFFATLGSLGAQLARTMTYPDHHTYTNADLDEILTLAREAGAGGVVTTEKDAVKIEGLLGSGGNSGIYALGIDAVITPSKKFKKLLAEIIGQPTTQLRATEKL